MTTRAQAAAAILGASKLTDLLDALRAFESTLDHDEDKDNELGRYGIDICVLPTFGGDTPTSTCEVWSWDADRVLVGTGPFSEWRIVDRT